MVLFGSKKEKKEGRGEIPTEKVKNFLNKGFSEIEIIDILRKEGYSPEEIDKALMQASIEIKSSQLFQSSQFQISQPQSQPQSPPQTPQPPQQSPLQTQIVETKQAQPTSIQNEIKESFEESQIDYISLQEYIDYLLRSKTQEINKRLMEINLKFKELEERVLGLKEEIESVSKGTKEDLNKILNEIRLNRDNINDLSIKVETLNKTLKELLPSLIESVRLLSEIIQKLKS
ncbi:MAG: hypothetical protein QXV63_00920 [Candidatus Aenigmatarchaeota archaeon]|nr:hypothetical protein [Candidatus Aenigmarchaeota archaeon]